MSVGGLAISFVPNDRAMKLIGTLLVLTILTACRQTQSQTKLTDKKITRDFQQDVNTLLPDGEYTVDIMDEVTMSPRRLELQEKFMKSMKENSEWFMEQQKIMEQTGKELSYDPRLGMTKAEWEELKKFTDNMTDMQAVSSGTAKITIRRVNNVLLFKSEGKLSSLNNTAIDMKNKIVQVDDYILKLTDTVCVTSADNVFKTAWRGYKFQFSDPPNAKMPTTQGELSNINLVLYGFTLGLFEKSGKTYIEISGSETKEGQPVDRYKIPIIFQ